VKVTGTTGAYAGVFEDVEAKLRAIADILDTASLSEEKLEDVQVKVKKGLLLGGYLRICSYFVQTKMDVVAKILGQTMANLDALDTDLASTKQSISQANSFLDLLKTDADKAKQAVQDMKERIAKYKDST